MDIHGVEYEHRQHVEKVNYMVASAFNETQALHQEIGRTPKEYHGTLLKMSQAFREGVSLSPAEARFARAWQQAKEGDVVPIDSVWDELGKDD